MIRGAAVVAIATALTVIAAVRVCAWTVALTYAGARFVAKRR